MSDKEPRRRKKRKDSQKKDDMRAEDQIFLATRSESKDSDQEIEEEVPVQIHQPSGFAKVVFLILFSGLVVSMSFIFISLHGAERGAADLFDDHHSEEQVSLENYDQTENISSTIDHDEGSESLSSSLESHEENENWSSEFLPENIRNMLPDIGNILSFNKEETKESVDMTSDEDSATEPDNLEVATDSSNEESLNDVESDIEKTEEVLEEELSPEAHADISSNSRDYEYTTESLKNVQEEPQQSSNENAATVVPESVDYSSPTQEPNYDYDDLDLTSEPFLEDLPSSTPPHNIVPEVVTESEPEDYTEDRFSSSMRDMFEAESETNADENIFVTTPEYEEDDRLLYEKAFVTNDADYEIREELDQLDSVLEKSAENVLRKCDELLKVHKESPRLHYLKAQAMDKLAEVQRSNKLLEDAITAYQRVMDLKDVPDELYLLAGKRAADRMRFRGFMGKSVKLLTSMMNKFPQNIELKNLVAVGYLLIGQNKAAKNEFIDVLRLAPNSGFAKVHLGFILKTDESNYKEAIKLMSEGIASKEDGVIDGRFYFHLGDALHRIGKGDEALQVYDEAVKEGLFLSRYQRSLYNVKGLTGKPWWNPKETPYSPYLKILERDWTLIRDEALSLTNEKNSGFLPETEGLQDTGDWKQFELFARGRKVEKNCVKAPKTCALVSQMPDAANCKRGQVKFSIMHPSTHVWAHTGPTNCRLRAHLGLVIPDGASIRVADEIRHWQEGKVILFDDSFEHEVWHNGSSSRLVLIVDFWHPELTVYQKRSLTPI